MSNKIVTHIVGGGASRISDAVLHEFVTRKEDSVNNTFGYSNMEFHYLDSSEVNYKNLKNPLGDLTLIGYDQDTHKVIDGSGADRRANAATLKKGVSAYVDKFKLHKRVTGEFNLVIFTASGGTSSVAGPFLIQELLQRDINVMGLCIGDSSNAIATQNTLNTLASLDMIAKNLNKCLSLLYFNNHLEDTKNLKKGESIANLKIRNALEILSIFLSGDNMDIDSKDMEIFLEQNRFQGNIQIPPGIYSILLTNGNKIDRENGVEPTMIRTLTIEAETNHSFEFDLVHAKNGIITSKEVIEKYKDAVPLIAAMLSNYFERECVGLKDRLDYFDQYLGRIKSHQIGGSKNSKQDDDLGLIL